jgi:hypothetical protein
MSYLVIVIMFAAVLASVYGFTIIPISSRVKSMLICALVLVIVGVIVQHSGAGIGQAGVFASVADVLSNLFS